MISVPPFNPKHTLNLSFEGGSPYSQELGHLNTNEKDLERSTLLMFEVGTGQAAAEIKSIFEISKMKFSLDGKYLSLGSKSGAVCVWAVGEHILTNIE